MNEGTVRPELPKRFYRTVALSQTEDGFSVLLDGRPIKTPARRPLAVPFRGPAETLVAEWDAQGERIDPATMPMTRLANTVVDGVADDLHPVRDDVGRYIETDLLFYRAGEPERLAARQREGWDPVLRWVQTMLGVRFMLAEGVMHVRQPESAVAAFRARLGSFDDPFHVAAMHQITTLTGSAVLALAVAERHLSAADAWRLAHIDEDWNIEQWGADEEAIERREARWQEMKVAAELLTAD